MSATTEQNREIIRKAFDDSYTWIMAMKDGLVVDGTAFYDSIAFNEFWDRVKP
ncbi:MAG TPA: hypothetical protein VH083_24000 [Myxococcales bacterium]|nr:hypothetical protein [Myxococcales bacterium]